MFRIFPTKAETPKLNKVKVTDNNIEDEYISVYLQDFSIFLPADKVLIHLQTELLASSGFPQDRGYNNKTYFKHKIA